MEQQIKENQVLVSHWGYEQTNVCFYEVYGRTNNFVTVIKKVTEVISRDGTHIEKVVAGETEGGEMKPIRRKVHVDPYDGTEFIKISSYERARVWNGEPQTQTTYG